MLKQLTCKGFVTFFMQAKSKEMYFKIMVREKKEEKEWVAVGGQSSSKQLSIARLCHPPLFFYEFKTQNH